MRLRNLGNLLRLGPQRLGAIFYHLPNFLRLFWRLLKDPRVGLTPKFLLLLVVAYVFSPIDFLPDFFPALGLVDDLLVVFLGLKGFVRLCPPQVVREHVQAVAAGK
ncbi:MAG: YkvA family protein [Candidatus Binatia bacterium]